MKGFGRRFFIYMIGFGMGCVLVWVMFYRNGDRASTMPTGRVLDFFESTEIKISDQLKCEIECNNLELNFMDSTFWENATVDFGKSAVRRKPCPEHYIESITKSGRKIGVYIENCEVCLDCEEDRTATLRSIVNLSEGDKACDC
ncbi:MAG: hypothetical protein JKY30_08780 [Flavobacteriales bacterium]|nr:hypothetical protein [Flavobacteriales bacterium]